MAIDIERYEQRIRALESLATRAPAQYRLRIYLASLLGYAYITLMLLVLLGLIGAVIAIVVATRRAYAGEIKILFFLGVLILLILRSLWVRFDPPNGMPITREESPKLFSLIDELTTTQGTPRVHQVIVNEDFNAGIQQSPRLGLFGWYRNYLVLGLPLMQLLTPDQFRAVLAHEFGHLSGKHGHFSSRMYRICQTWNQLMEQMEEQSAFGAFLFKRFAKWYVPFLYGFAFVLLRRHEYEADQCSVSLVGPEITGDALLRIHVLGETLSEQFWKDIYKRVDTEETPQAAPFALISQAMPDYLTVERTRTCLAEKLAEESGFGDVHPALADRLRAVGVTVVAETIDPLLPPALEQSAAVDLLGPQAHSLIEQMNALWQQAVTPSWQERHQYMQTAKARLAELEQQDITAHPDNELWERTRLTYELRENPEAVPLLRAMLERQPAHAEANFLLGMILLETDDETGIAHLEQAMAVDSELVLTGCGLIYGYLTSHHRAEEARAYMRRASGHSELEEKAAEERKSLQAHDKLLPHGLTVEQMAALREQFAAVPGVKIAYYARKPVRYFPERPCYVLAMALSVKKQEEIAHTLETLRETLTLPGETIVILLDGDARAVEGRIKKVEDSLIFAAGKGVPAGK